MRHSPRPSWLAIALAVVGGLGACAVFVGALGPTMLGAAWPILAAGLLALVISLVGLWRVFRRRDRTLW